MTTYDRLDHWKRTHPAWWWLAKIAAAGLFVAGLLAALLALLVVASTPIGQAAANIAVWLLAGDRPQVTWYVTRAAGLTGYLLLWLSTAWGLAVPSRILDGKLHGSYTYDFHQFISLLSIGFIGLHVLILLFDQYLPFNLAQILFPFLSTYRPGWVGLGVLSLYIILLVTVTFYLRERIGRKAFRSIHVLSLLGFAGSALHGLFAGTDSPLPVVQAMYAFTGLSIVFLTTYWLASLAARKRASTRVTVVSQARRS